MDGEAQVVGAFGASYGRASAMDAHMTVTPVRTDRDEHRSARNGPRLLVVVDMQNNFAGL
jgi:hypothetical protein